MATDDMTLLREFATQQSQSAFTTLVERHIGLVHSAALRQTGDAEMAEEVSQVAFLLLARKAASLGPDTILPAWLYRATRFAALNALKIQHRRRQREQEAYMQSNLQSDDSTDAWQQLSPLLDQALAELSESDRAPVILRYFENRPWRDVANLLHLNEDAAQKRLTRALEKLRKYFAQRGVNLSVQSITTAVSAHSVHAAPAGLSAKVLAAYSGTLSTTTLTTLLKTSATIMNISKTKIILGAAAALLLAASIATIAFWPASRNQPKAPGPTETLTVEQIFQKSRAAYQNLQSYSDDGKTVSSIGGNSFTTTFNIKLARPASYRIEWSQAVTPSFSNTGVVWSAGEGDYVVLGQRPARKEESQQSALASATGVSASAAATIPGTFFQMNWGNQLALGASQKQLADERIGDTECYVFTSESKGRAKTMWIGKDDFMIHQVRTEVSTQTVQAALDQAAKINGPRPGVSPQPITYVETHEHIVLNPSLSPSDFAR